MGEYVGVAWSEPYIAPSDSVPPLPKKPKKENLGESPADATAACAPSARRRPRGPGQAPSASAPRASSPAPARPRRRRGPERCGPYLLDERNLISKDDLAK